MQRLGRGLVSLVSLVSLAACGTKEPPPPADPSTMPTASASSSADDANRALTRAECDGLAQSMLDACEKRGNTHSIQIDRWCSDLAHRVTDGSWVAKECLPHIKFIDATCMQSATNVTSAMDCERSVAP